MDISNTSSLFEVFLGLNVATSLFDNFSSLLFNYFIGNNNVKSNIRYLSKMNGFFTEREETADESDKKEIAKAKLEIESYSRYLNTSFKNKTNFLQATKYFDDCSFLAALFCGYILLQIAINSKLSEFDASLIFILSLAIILSNLLFLVLEGLFVRKLDILPPIITPGIIFLLIFSLSYFGTTYWFNNHFTFFPLNPKAFIVLISCTPLTHIVFYFIRFHFNLLLIKAYSFGFTLGSLGDITNLRKELIKKEKLTINKNNKL